MQDSEIAHIDIDYDKFVEIRDLFYLRSGIYFTSAWEKIISERVKLRMKFLAFANFEDYIAFLRSDKGQAEISSLYNQLAPEEAFFFSNEQQFAAFEKIIKDEILRKDTDSVATVRVWSASASTGEEAYSLGMIFLEQVKPLFPNAKIQIIGSDVNDEALAVARRGEYPERSMINLPNAYKQKYFLQQGNKYIISDEVKRLIRFVSLNMYNSDEIKHIQNCDVIFCRNVLVYLDLETKKKLISDLYDSLNTGGYLFIGYTESLHGVSKLFKLNHLPKALGYKKE